MITWKTQAIQPIKEARKAPIRVQRARRPRKKDSTAKNRPMRMNANMNRVIKK